MLKPLIEYGRSLNVPFGYDYRTITHQADIEDGSIIPLNEPKRMLCPVIVRSSGPSPCIYADQVKYFFRDGKYQETMLNMIRESGSSLSKEVLLKLETGFDGVEDIENNDMIVFVRGDRMLIDEPEVQLFWKNHIISRCQSDILGQCMYCLKEKNLVSKIPKKVNGLDLINNNLEVSKSYTNKDNFVFPMCMECINFMTDGLSSLVKENENNFRFDNNIVLFWCGDDIKIENIFSLLIAPKPADLKRLFKSMFYEKHIAIDSTQFNMLVIQKSEKSRAILRDFRAARIDILVKNIEKWFSFHSGGVHSLFKIVSYFTFKKEGRAIINNKNEKAGLVEDFMNFALFNKTLPKKYLYLVLKKCMRSRDIASVEETIIKMYNIADEDRAYSFGKLFWEISHIQRFVLGNLNRSISDKYFSLAVKDPRNTFVKLMKHSHRLSTALQRKSFGAKINFDKKIDALVSQMGVLPCEFSTKEQASFYVGFCDQRRSFFERLQREK